MDQLVKNLRLRAAQNSKLTGRWRQTKTEAYKKLDSFRPKIGYPVKWRDYSAVASSRAT